MAHRARLDATGIYWGVDAVDGELAEGDVEVAADCDLAPGAYRWNAELGRFDPLPPSQRLAVEGAPSLESAFYQLASALRPTIANAPLVGQWCEAYERTVEGRKTS